MFANLETLADSISKGHETIASAKDYSAEGYELTHEDKINSGGFGELY